VSALCTFGLSANVAFDSVLTTLISKFLRAGDVGNQSIHSAASAGGGANQRAIQRKNQITRRLGATATQHYRQISASIFRKHA